MATLAVASSLEPIVPPFDYLQADTNTAVISVRDMIKNLEAMSTLKGDRSDDASMQRRDVSRESKGHSAASIMVHPTSARDVSELSRDIMSIMNAED
eukprot:scaffold1211_cov337-Prasinococcus_capsulatus_cf.AAC.6